MAARRRKSHGRRRKRKTYRGRRLRKGRGGLPESFWGRAALDDLAKEHEGWTRADAKRYLDGQAGKSNFFDSLKQAGQFIGTNIVPVGKEIASIAGLGVRRRGRRRKM